MEARDTVLGKERLDAIDLKNAESNFTDALLDVAREQAEISFKVGIKEVVEWGLETCPHDLFGEGTQCYKRACDECWREQLKVWGVEDA